MHHINLELFKKYYYEDRLPLTQIAKKFNFIAVHNLYLFMRKNKLEFRPKLCLVEDVTGQKFNKLIFLKYIRNDKFGKAIWLCKCECGKEKELNACSIKAGLTTSCGCNREKIGRKKGYKLISWGFFRKLRKSALSRDYEFNLTIEFLWELFEKQNKLCAISGVPISLFPDSNRSRSQTASVDRIDSSKGYTIDNVQWVHKRINRLKNILNTDELVFWADRICKINDNKPIKNFDTNILTWD